MNDSNKATNDYHATLKKELTIAGSVVLGALAVVMMITFFAHNSTPKLIYQPANACDLFTPAEAKELLGEHKINSNVNTPIVSGNAATSRCGYTDGNPDTDNMVVAAIIVRSAVNDKGIEKNKNDFAANKPASGTVDVSDLGDSAYFNKQLGQLNILSGRNWIILSYGIGSAPETNTLSSAMELANKVLSSNEV